MKDTIVSALRLEREKRGWSRNYIAEQAEVDMITVGRWERGERLPHPHHRQKLCTLFEMNAQDLGLLSGLPEVPNTVAIVPASSPEIPDALISKESDHATTIPDPSLETPDAFTGAPDTFSQSPSMNINTGEAPAQLYRRRPFLLIGLVGVTALAGGAFSYFSTSSKRPRSSAPLQMVQLFDPNNQWVNNLAWSPDGNKLVVANGAPMVTLWNVEKSAILASYSTQDQRTDAENQWVNDVSWSNANHIAAATVDATNLAGTIQIWTFPGTKTPFLPLSRPYPLRTVSWSPNGQYLAFAGRDTKVEIWGPLNNNPVSYYLDAGQDAIAISRVKWSPDATYLAAATDGGIVYVWEVKTRRKATIYQRHTKRVADLAWCPEGHLIASASLDRTVHVWNALNGQTLVIYRGHTDEVHGIDWSPNGKYVVSAGYDNTAQVWNGHTGEQVVTYNERSKGLCALWSIDGRTIALGSQQNSIEIVQVPSL